MGHRAGWLALGAGIAGASLAERLAAPVEIVGHDRRLTLRALNGRGEALVALFETIARETAPETALSALARDCANVARWMRDDASLDDRLAGSVPFCTMAAVCVAGWQLAKQAAAVKAGAAPELAASKPVTVRFFLDRIVPEAAGLKAGAIAGADLLYALPAEALVG